MAGNLKQRVTKLEQSSGSDFETKIRKLAEGFKATIEDEIWEAVRGHERELNRQMELGADGNVLIT